ncbi:hypothetical protein, partial [Streptomyces sp. AB3(2024)]|uniref:hypothetical protein n=1 Tax=Streptomyces sp. AB3(2024) TaxID=3317321 RepID=UPI0035A3B0A9
MTAYAKHLPTGATPASDIGTWGVEAGERWRAARAPAVFAPGAGSRILGFLVALALTLILRNDAPGWNDAPGPPAGTAWRAYPDGLLLVALPLWYRYLPGATVVSATLLAVESAVTLPARPAADTAGRTGLFLVCLLSLWALTGAALRLRARRRQTLLARAAAGPARFPLPARLPTGHDRRGNGRLLGGAFLCLVGAGILLDGILGDFGAHGGPHPYDAVGQQCFALPLLVLGSTLLGAGWSADLAARRLHRAPQPVLLVGVRAAPSGHFWLYPDADTIAGRPLIPYRPRREDTLGSVRLLARGAEGSLPRGLHDMDARAEPFEAVLYGAPYDGAEVVLEYAVHGGAGISASVTAAALLPRRRHGLDRWIPAGVSYEKTLERRRERERERFRTYDPPTWRKRTTRGTAATTGTGAAATGGCGGDGGGCGGSGCGGGCGGC